MTDEELDAWLTRGLQEEVLPDRGFSDGVLGRLRRHRQARRLTLAAVAAVATAGSLLAAAVSPAGARMPDVSVGDLVATLILAAACSLVWLATEAGGRLSWPADRRMESRDTTR